MKVVTKGGVPGARGLYVVTGELEDKDVEELCMDPKQRFASLVKRWDLAYDLDSRQYRTEAEAIAGHAALLEKWHQLRGR
jgi:hypothetical protein